MGKNLANNQTARKYLSDALRRNNPQGFLANLREVVDAKIGMTKLAEQTGLSRGTLYKTLSEEGNPKIDTLVSILDTIDLKLSIR